MKNQFINAWVAIATALLLAAAAPLAAAGTTDAGVVKVFTPEVIADGPTLESSPDGSALTIEAVGVETPGFVIYNPVTGTGVLTLTTTFVGYGGGFLALPAGDDAANVGKPLDVETGSVVLEYVDAPTVGEDGSVTATVPAVSADTPGFLLQLDRPLFGVSSVHLERGEETRTVSLLA